MERSTKDKQNYVIVTSVSCDTKCTVTFLGRASTHRSFRPYLLISQLPTVNRFSLYKTRPPPYRDILRNIHRPTATGAPFLRRERSGTKSFKCPPRAPVRTPRHAQRAHSDVGGSLRPYRSGRRRALRRPSARCLFQIGAVQLRQCRSETGGGRTPHPAK